MPPGSECSSAMLLLRNNRQPEGNTRDHWHHYAPKVGVRILSYLVAAVLNWRGLAADVVSGQFVTHVDIAMPERRV